MEAEWTKYHDMGVIWEDDFERMTSSFSMMYRQKNRYSTYDFKFYEGVIELKHRQFTFTNLPSVFIKKDKYNKLRQHPGALYFNRFADGSMYVADLKAIKTPLEEEEMKVKNGPLTLNLHIPKSFFIYLPDENSVRSYLTNEKDRLYRQIYKGDTN
ncbi:hypothetical protein [Deinococcus sp. Leaf326]|uniref:hypothetical protein n=1 Tax=Deinococcus sp. Leaf326 TaxID=1736338 RepID=UPI000A89F26F|nr:hypothetical protein [Deinococcus sp. Leaf326]